MGNLVPLRERRRVFEYRQRFRPRLCFAGRRRLFIGARFAARTRSIEGPRWIQTRAIRRRWLFRRFAFRRLGVGGDLIVALDGQEVQDQQQLSRIMNNHRAGDTVKVTIYRGKRKIEIDVTLGEAREQV